MRYDSFGKPLDDLQTLVGYTGREWDAESKLQYNRARYYDLATGRYSIPFNDGSNNYVYVLNNSTGFTDPLGLAHVTQTAVSKSYINTIANVGSMPSWGATAALWAFAQFTNQAENDGQVSTPAADGRYRLRAQIDI